MLADALTAYCKKHHACGGFVCYSEEEEEEDELLISTDGFSEDKTAPCWRLLSDMI